MFHHFLWQKDFYPFLDMFCNNFKHQRTALIFMLEKLITLSAVKSLGRIFWEKVFYCYHLVAIDYYLYSTFSRQKTKTKMEQNTKFTKNQKRRLEKRQKAIRTALYAYFKYYERNRWMRSITILIDENFKHCMSVLAKEGLSVLRFFP